MRNARPEALLMKAYSYAAKTSSLMFDSSWGIMQNFFFSSPLVTWCKIIFLSENLFSLEQIKPVTWEGEGSSNKKVLSLASSCVLGNFRLLEQQNVALNGQGNLFKYFDLSRAVSFWWQFSACQLYVYKGSNSPANVFFQDHRGEPSNIILSSKAGLWIVFFFSFFTFFACCLWSFPLLVRTMFPSTPIKGKCRMLGMVTCLSARLVQGGTTKPLGDAVPNC